MLPRLPTLSALALLTAQLAGCEWIPGLKQDDTSPADTEDSTTEEEDFHWPSQDGWPDPGLPGWMGRTRISTTEGCWTDTDGVAPADAGCHLLHDGDDTCSSCGDLLGEQIGEACHTFTSGEGDSVVWLVETNPDAGTCHGHAGGEGHPDVFDCDVYCKGTVMDGETGATWAAGTCQVVPSFDCDGTPIDSARCECTP